MKKFQSIIPDHIPEEEIPNIIQRASELQSKVIYGDTEYTTHELQDIAQELEIEAQYIKKALEELYKEERNTKTTKKVDHQEMLISNKNLLIAIIFLLFCLLVVFLLKDNTSDTVLSGNYSTIIVSGANSIIKAPQPSTKEISTSEIDIHKQQQALLQQQIELLEKKNKLLKEQTDIQKNIEQQKELLEERKRILEERGKLIDERKIEQVSENKQKNIIIQIEKATNTTTNQQENDEIKTYKAPSAKFEGNWELISYHLYDKEKNSFLEVAVVKDKIEIRESWYFHSGRFRHIMDENLSFSGKYEVLDNSSLPTLKDIDLISGSDFIIHAYDIATNFGSQIQHHYYYVEFDDNHLILYNIGRQLQYRQPNQGHEFTRSR